MDTKVITDEEMEKIGVALTYMTPDQIHLVRNKIDQIMFERMVNGQKEYSLRVEVDESSPIGVRIELPQELKDMIANSTEEMNKALAALNNINIPEK